MTSRTTMALLMHVPASHKYGGDIEHPSMIAEDRKALREGLYHVARSIDGCQECLLAPATKRCSRCPALYCSTECQNKNWKQHKPWCGANPMREAYHQNVIKGYEAACPETEEELDKIIQDNSPMGPAASLQRDQKAPTLSNPIPAGSTPLDTALTTFLDHLQPEIAAALYSSLSLLSRHPRNKSHALVLLLEFDPAASDPSIAFSITEARVESLADVDRAIDGLSKDGGKPAIGGRSRPLEKYLRDLKPPPSALVAALFCIAVVKGSNVTTGAVRPLSLSVGWMPDAAAKIQTDGEWEEWFLERAKMSAFEKGDGVGASEREMARLMTWKQWREKEKRGGN